MTESLEQRLAKGKVD